jgi:glyoxylase-like metal-dependent hydrolase (beta-lactamase superfamily II)
VKPAHEGRWTQADSWQESEAVMADTTNNSEVMPGDKERFEELGRNCYAYSSDGCSNTGVVVGERGVLIVDGQATPEHAERVLQKVRDITDKPVKQVVLTHFHADNTLGTQVFEPNEIIASDLTRRMMDTRGAEEIHVSRERFPTLFSGLPVDAGVNNPTMTIASSMTIDLGGLEVRLMHLGRGHTMGDLMVWVPESGVIFAGDLVQSSAAAYCGDAHLADWPRALDRVAAFRPTALMPGRGRSALGASAVATAVENTREFIITLRDSAEACVEQSLGLKDTFNAVQDALAPRFGSKSDFAENLPFNVARAYDEALGLDQPQIWTRERWADLQDALNGIAPAAIVDDATDVAIDDSLAEPELTQEQPLEDQATEDLAAEEIIEAAEEIEVEEALEKEPSSLVSESDFAASLVLDDGEGTLLEDDGALDLSSDDIVEPEQDDQDTSAERKDSGPENEQAEKVLEDARY